MFSFNTCIVFQRAVSPKGTHQFITAHFEAVKPCFHCTRGQPDGVSRAQHGPEKIRRNIQFFAFLLGMLMWLSVLELQCGELSPLNI